MFDFGVFFCKNLRAVEPEEGCFLRFAVINSHSSLPNPVSVSLLWRQRDNYPPRPRPSPHAPSHRDSCLI